MQPEFVDDAHNPVAPEKQEQDAELVLVLNEPTLHVVHACPVLLMNVFAGQAHPVFEEAHVPPPE